MPSTPARSNAHADTLDPGEPYAIADLARTLGRLTREGAALMEGLPLEVFFAPQRDRWSPAEHVRHLVKSSRPLILAYRLPRFVSKVLFGSATTPSRTFVALRDDYRSLLAAGGKAGRFAPSAEGTPRDPAARRREILAAWHDVNDRVSTAWTRWRGIQLDQAVFPHPLLGKLTAREMAMFTVYHTSHHLTLVRDRLPRM
ncbi:MAG: DinB family protein [Gemmatimonadaceae bacterium]